MSPERLARMKAVLARRQPDLTVVMDNVHKPHNLAAIVRTADAVGIPLVHGVSPHAEFRLRQKSASGSGKWVGVETHEDIAGCFERLRGQGMRIYCAHLSETAVDFRQIDFTRPTAVVVGAELEGVGEEAAALADGHVIIPMLGMVESLNVSVATAILLYEAQRQREAAGLYEQPRLDPETMERILFEWSYPDIADYCRRKGLPYPALDENGMIAEPLADRDGNRRLP
ncbi:MAG: tRNA (guanosine(18)-2'-O)-methyltransferase TrmH [Gammaproteobacteria bacterium]|nr:MAG: tRNA (guanosine(18)-2'-O)-methyltransferase TrmH [Gammaproteobacteria bacterium]